MKKARLAVFLLALVGAVASVPASASSILYDNTTSQSGTFDGWYINHGISTTDSFTLSQASTITGIDFESWLASGDTLLSVDWSIGTSPYSGNPATASVTTGNYLGSPSPSYGVYDEGISIPNLSLAAGTYYLTFENASTADYDYPLWDVSNGASVAYSTAYGVGSIGSETFQILGTPNTNVVPEPSSFLLLGSGLVGFAGMIRRKLKA